MKKEDGVKGRHGPYIVPRPFYIEAAAGSRCSTRGLRLIINERGMSDGS